MKPSFHRARGFWPYLLAGSCLALMSACSALATSDTAPAPEPSKAQTLPATLVLPTPYVTPRASAAPLEPEAKPSTVSLPVEIVTPAGCTESGEIVLGNYTSRVTGLEHKYRIYLPPCYSREGHAYPVLYIFHGSAQTDSHWDDLGLDEAAESAILAGEIPPLIIVMPDGGQIAQNTSGGAGSFEDLILVDLIPHIESSYCVWSEAAGRAIGGLSRGGYWALEIAFRNSMEFVAAAGHSAALLDTAAGPDVNPQNTALTGNLVGLRIYLDIGNSDWVFNNTHRLHEDMLAAGIPHNWQLNEGSHEDAYWSAHVAEYLSWYSESWPVVRSQYPPCLGTNE